MRAELHSLGCPLVEMGLDVDGSAGALAAADTPVLLEGLGALDGRLVDTPALGDLVVASIDSERTLVSGLGRRIVVAEALNDVVLDQGVGGPAIDGEVGVAVWLVGTRVCDGPESTMLDGQSSLLFTQNSLVVSGHPSLSTDEVTARLPAHGVGAAVLVGVSHIRSTIGPESVVEAAVCSSAAGSARANRKVHRVTLDRSGGHSESACYCRAGEDEGRESNHDDR